MGKGWKIGMYNTIKTIRYMGNKNRLLDFIIPEIFDEKWIKYTKTSNSMGTRGIM